MPVEAFGVTDPGERHPSEDGFGSHPELGLHLVVDGMGGNGGVAVEATRLILDVVRATYAGGQPGAVGLVHALEAADAALHRRHQQAEGGPVDARRWIGTGAAVVALALTADEAHVAHLGDCRGLPGS